MSVAIAINDLSSRIQSAYDACESKGATMPASKTTWNLSSTIESIPAGGGDWYGVDLNEFASVDENGQLRQTNVAIDVVFDGVKSIEERMFNSSIFGSAYTSNKPFFIQLKSLSFPDLLSTGSQSFLQAFRNQPTLTAVAFPKLQHAATSAFYNAFQNDSVLTALRFPELTSVGAQAFYYCNQGTAGTMTMEFPKLKNIVANQVFQQNASTPTNIKVSALIMPELEVVNGNSVFTGLMSYQTTRLELPKLKSVTGTNAVSQIFAGQNAAATYPQLTSFNLSSLESVSGSNALAYLFANCTRLTSAAFPSLTTLSETNALASMFYGCTLLSSVSFPALETVKNNVFNSTFQNCTALKRLDFPELTSMTWSNTYSAIFGNSFLGTVADLELHMPKLTSITGGTTKTRATFYNCYGMKKIYLDSVSNIENSYVFNNCTYLTEIHFGAANQAAIEATTGYATLWGRGAGAATVYFDLQDEKARRKMTIETTYILKADEGKLLRNKTTGLQTIAVWLKVGDSKDDWEEIDIPEEDPVEEPEASE